MYRVEVANKGSSQFTVRSSNYEFVIDTKGSGITPPDTLLASIASCLGVYIRKYADGAKINIGEFSVSAEADFTKDAPVCFNKIKISIDLKGAHLEDKRAASLLEFVKNCPVHNTLRCNPQVEISIR